MKFRFFFKLFLQKRPEACGTHRSQQVWNELNSVFPHILVQCMPHFSPAHIKHSNLSLAACVLSHLQKLWYHFILSSNLSCSQLLQIFYTSSRMMFWSVFSKTLTIIPGLAVISALLPSSTFTHSSSHLPASHNIAFCLSSPPSRKLFYSL